MAGNEPYSEGELDELLREVQIREDGLQRDDNLQELDELLGEIDQSSGLEESASMDEASREGGFQDEDREPPILLADVEHESYPIKKLIVEAFSSIQVYHLLTRPFISFRCRLDEANTGLSAANCCLTAKVGLNLANPTQTIRLKFEGPALTYWSRYLTDQLFAACKAEPKLKRLLDCEVDVQPADAMAERNTSSSMVLYLRTPTNIIMPLREGSMMYLCKRIQEVNGRQIRFTADLIHDCDYLEDVDATIFGMPSLLESPNRVVIANSSEVDERRSVRIDNNASTCFWGAHPMFEDWEKLKELNRETKGRLVHLKDLERLTNQLLHHTSTHREVRISCFVYGCILDGLLLDSSGALQVPQKAEDPDQEDGVFELQMTLDTRHKTLKLAGCERLGWEQTVKVFAERCGMISN